MHRFNTFFTVNLTQTHPHSFILPFFFHFYFYGVNVTQKSMRNQIHTHTHTMWTEKKHIQCAYHKFHLFNICAWWVVVFFLVCVSLLVQIYLNVANFIISCEMHTKPKPNEVAKMTTAQALHTLTHTYTIYR